MAILSEATQHHTKGHLTRNKDVPITWKGQKDLGALLCGTEGEAVFVCVCVYACGLCVHILYYDIFQ